MKLTKQQQRIKQKIIETINQNKSYKNIKPSAITGGAGTGKTFLTKSLVLDLGFRNIYVTAPTHQALNVLKNQFSDILELIDKRNEEQIQDMVKECVGKTKSEIHAIKNKYPVAQIYFKTVQSLLGMRPNYVVENYDPNNLDFEVLSPKYVFPHSIIIVDEASMLNAYTLKSLTSLSLQTNSYLIFLGDVNQLPPVNEEKNEIFTEEHSHLYVLEDIIRTNKEDIKQYCENVKEGMFYLPSYQSDSIRIIPLSQYQYDDDCILAYRNATVETMNTKYKKFHHDTTKFRAGDVIKINMPLKVNGIDLHNNDLLKIEEMKVTPKDNVRLTCAKIGNPNLDDPEEVIRIKLNVCLDEKYYGKEYSNWLNVINKSEARLYSHIIEWSSEGEIYYKKLPRPLSVIQAEEYLAKYRPKSKKSVAESFITDKEMNILEFNEWRYENLIGRDIRVGGLEIKASFKLSNAMTIHKAQGSTFNNVAVAYSDIFGKDAQELLYVAISRARERLTLLI